MAKDRDFPPDPEKAEDMAANDISVRISADTADLVAKLAAVQAQLRAFADDMQKLAGQMQGATTVAAGPGAAAAKSNAAAQQSAEEWRKTKATLGQQAYQTEVTELDEEVAAGKVTAAQKIDIERQLLTAKFAADQEALQSALNGEAAGSAAAMKYYDQLVEGQSKTNLALEKLNLQAADAQKKVWDDLSNHIGDAFGHVLDAVDQRGKSLGGRAEERVRQPRQRARRGRRQSVGQMGDFGRRGFSRRGCWATRSGWSAGGGGDAASTTAQTTAVTANTTALSALTAAMTGHAAATTTATAAQTVKHGRHRRQFGRPDSRRDGADGQQRRHDGQYRRGC